MYGERGGEEQAEKFALTWDQHPEFELGETPLPRALVIFYNGFHTHYLLSSS